MLDWQHPPRNWEELQVWKVFLRTTDQHVWALVRAWLVREGNPWIIPEEEEQEAYTRRQVYQEALRVTYAHNNR